MSLNASLAETFLQPRQEANSPFAELAADAVFVLSADGGILQTNSGAHELLALGSLPPSALNILDMAVADCQALVTEALKRAWQGEPRELLASLRAGDGVVHRLALRFFRDEQTENVWLVGVNLAKMARLEHESAQHQFVLEQAITEAFGKGEFFPCYQPIVDLSGQVKGCEALLRWRTADGRFIAPSVFIPAAERSGFISELGLFVLHTALKQLREFDAAGLENLYVSVNISPYQLQLPQFESLLRDALQSAGVAPHRLMLEVTEGVSVVDPQHAKAVLTRVAEMGVRISLDDYGTGYAGMTYLKTFPVSTIKIDRMFVKDLGDATTDTLLQGLVYIAKNLGVTLIAEGVESADQALKLTALNVDAMQGFFYGKPVSGDAFIALFAPEVSLKSGTAG